MSVIKQIIQPRPLDRTRARACAIVNQCATPGLGTLFAGRYISGGLQLLVASTGFLFVIGWFLQKFAILLHQFSGGHSQAMRYPWMGKVGLMIFFVAWCWALVSSISILRSVRLPPKLET